MAKADAPQRLALAPLTLFLVATVPLGLGLVLGVLIGGGFDSAKAAAVASELYESCPPSSEPHRLPLVTHFMQGTHGNLSLVEELVDGIVVEFTAPVARFAPITPYVYAMFGNEHNVVADDSAGRMDHGFLNTAAMVRTLAWEFGNHTGPGLPDTIGPSIAVHRSLDACPTDTTMQTLRWQGCRPAPNCAISFQGDASSAVSRHGSNFVLEITSFTVAGSESDGTEALTFRAFAPEVVPLIEEGAMHLPPAATARHYHWHSDCASAVSTQANAAGLSSLLPALHERLAADANDSPGLFSLMCKGG